MMKQVGGDHYQLPIEPITVIFANQMDYASGNVFKYLSRWRTKNGIDDLRKAQHYIDMLIDEVEANPGRYGLGHNGLPIGQD